MKAEALPALSPPHVRAHTGCDQLDRSVLIATLPVLLASIWLRGVDAIVLYACASAAAIAAAVAWNVVMRSADGARWLHAAVVGLLLAMMLPPAEAPWRAAVGAVLGVLITRGLRDRFQTYVWHPAVVGWLLLYTVIPGQPAVSTQRPIDELVAASSVKDGAVAGLREAALYRLPPWESTLLGQVAGGIGEVCVLAIIASGVWLVFARRLRWQMPVAAVLAAGVAAALWPIHASDGSLLWAPVVLSADGFPIGATLVLYHLTGGGLLLACVFLAADSLSTPLNVRGHALFGVGLGALTVVLRSLGVNPGACWWALAVMNVLVPAINRVTRRRVWGT